MASPSLIREDVLGGRSGLCCGLPCKELALVLVLVLLAELMRLGGTGLLSGFLGLALLEEGAEAALRLSLSVSWLLCERREFVACLFSELSPFCC